MRHVVTLLSSLLLLAALPSAAQKPVDHDVLITFSGLVNDHGYKIVRSALHEVDERALVSISIPLQQAKFHSSVDIDQAMLASICAPYGIQVVSIDRLDIDPVRRSLLHVLPGFPEFIDTGHPEQDAADYAARKQAWIDAHPDRYPPPAQLEEHEH